MSSLTALAAMAHSSNTSSGRLEHRTCTHHQFPGSWVPDFVANEKVGHEQETPEVGDDSKQVAGQRPGLKLARDNC